MMADLKSHVDDPTDEGQVREYLQAVLDKKALDGLGLIYGMGHAVYSLSDPRAEVLRGFVQDISKEKGLNREMDMYLTVEKVAKELLTARTGKPVAVNVDFYSGFLYDMLGLPKELYTPAVCHRPHGRLERPPHGGAGRKQQDHPSGLQVH